jgi:RNA polymerase sigma-70 factor (ECF subfamily)
VALDPDTIAAVRSGDRAAFERLFRAWYARLAEYAAGITRSRDTAEDVVQEVFIAVWRRRDALPDADKVGAYLHRAVRNRALNQLRGQKGMSSLSDEEMEEPASPVAADADVEYADLASAVAAALDSLAPRTREVFLLSREQELTYAQIADTLGLSVKTVETLMGRALRAMRARLNRRDV